MAIESREPIELATLKGGWLNNQGTMSFIGNILRTETEARFFAQ